MFQAEPLKRSVAIASKARLSRDSKARVPIGHDHFRSLLHMSALSDRLLRKPAPARGSRESSRRHPGNIGKTDAATPISSPDNSADLTPATDTGLGLLVWVFIYIAIIGAIIALIGALSFEWNGCAVLCSTVVPATLAAHRRAPRDPGQ